MNSDTEKYIHFVDEWLQKLEDLSSIEIFKNPKSVAVLSIDLTNGFCRSGNLASARVATIIQPVVDILQLAWSNGVRCIALLHDCHTPDAEEFHSFAQHAVCGSAESEAVEEIKALPFYKHLKIIPKNSVDPSQNTELDEWLRSNPALETFMVIGDCTDICVYQLAMHLKTYANARDLKWRVVVPEDCVDTYEQSVETAVQVDVNPHPGELLHRIFLHHMALNGIEIVRRIV